MKVAGIIPARYASTRFPAKPLADIGGQSMIERVYHQASQCKSLDQVMVATDHQKIYDHVKKKGIEVYMTSPNHPSGTDRCFETLTLVNKKFDYIINIQGDEPFIAPAQIDLLASMLDGKVQLATLKKKILDSSDLENTNIVKVITNKSNEAIYFSRKPLPCIRNIAVPLWLTHHTYYKHIGLYAYRADVLKEIVHLPISSLEKAESLEQLRWIENGYRVQVRQTEQETISIDTPEDLSRALAHLRGTA